MEKNEASGSGPDVAKDFGDRVRTWRKARGLTQAELAQRLSDRHVQMHHTTVAKLENGARPTTIEELWTLAAVLECDFHDLMTPPSTTETDDDLKRAVDAVELARMRAQRLQAVYEAAGHELAQAVQELKQAETVRDEAGLAFLMRRGRGEVDHE